MSEWDEVKGIDPLEIFVYRTGVPFDRAQLFGNLLTHLVNDHAEMNGLDVREICWLAGQLTLKRYLDLTEGLEEDERNNNKGKD